MEIKLIEIRDRATFIPAIAVGLTLEPALPGETEKYLREMYLLRRAGYSREQIQCNPERGEFPEEIYVLLTKLDGGSQAHYDPFSWASRTMGTVHQWLITHWREFKSGDVLDVEFILGESKAPKTSEQFDWIVP